MTDEEFAQHVNEEKNDFSAWISTVLHNDLLAKDLLLEANMTDKGHCAMTIRDHVAWLESLEA